MGYDTRFKGAITIEPPCDLELYNRVNDYCRDEDKVRDGKNVPDYGWCDWLVSKDGKAIGHYEETEKSYEMEAWLRVLVRDFFAPAGRVLNGSMLAQGEDMEDRWCLNVKDNEVTRTDAKPDGVVVCPECQHRFVAVTTPAPAKETP